MELYNSGITCLIYCILAAFDPIYSNQCGTLSFEQKDVTKCQTASLIYKPYHMTLPRKWIREDGKKNILYNTERTNNETKYIESRRDDSVVLKILATDLTDRGSYIVECAVNVYSERASLNVTQGSSVPGCSGKCGDLSIQNTNVKEGDLIVLRFTVYPGKSVTWEMKHGSTFEELVENRYNIIANAERTSHSLTVLKSLYEDRGEYRVNCDTSVSNSVNLNVVYREPSVPAFSHVESTDYCQPNGCILANLNEPVTVECFVKGGSKPIDLKMLKNGQEIKDIINVPEDNDAYNYVKYNFAPTKSDVDNEVILTCIVNNPALSEALSSNSTILYVKVPPEKDPEFNSIEVREGMQGQVQCVERNVRPPLKAKLFIKNKVEPNTSKTDKRMPGNLYTVTTSTTKTFTRFQNQVTAMCCSCINDQKCGRTKVNVLFPPKYVSVEEIKKDNQENGDTMVQLKYLVAVSNPKSSYELTGTKNIQRSLVSKTYERENDTRGWTLTAVWNFTFTRDHDKRKIAFNVVTEGFQAQSVQYKINITYYPIVTISGQNTVYLGDDVIFTCNVTSNPPSTVTWYNQTGLIKESYETGKLNLHLTNVSTDHSQTYICTANNGIGETKSRNITLFVKDPSERPVTEALTPTNESNLGSVIGPVIGCLILVIIIAIIMVLIIRKKRRNEPLERRNTPQIKIEERKPSVNPPGNEPIYNNMAASRNDGVADEPPEYACVIPKKKRGEARGNTEASKDAGKENKGGEDNLVYADLDIAEYPDLATKRPLVTMNEQTEYVSIDFSKTGAAMIDKGD